MEKNNEYINVYEDYKIYLNSNEIYVDMDENILIKMKACLKGVDLNRYPDECMLEEIKKLYGKYAGVESKNIIVGNGSDEMLELITSATIEPGKRALALSPDFVMYDFFVPRFGGDFIKYDLKKNMKFNVEEFIDLGRQENIDLIILSNPNNPTGIGINVSDIVRILEEFTDKTIVVDEAYFEFYGQTMVPYIDKYKNLMVTRTLSKAWGLAALRVGFLITNEDNINRLKENKVPYTVSSYSLKLASILLKCPDRVLENTKKIVEQREYLYLKLKELQKNSALNIKFYESKGNFIYGKTPYKEALMRGLANRGILIRNLKDDTFRITVGSSLENKKLLEGLEEIFLYQGV